MAHALEIEIENHYQWYEPYPHDLWIRSAPPRKTRISKEALDLYCSPAPRETQVLLCRAPHNGFLTVHSEPTARRVSRQVPRVIVAFYVLGSVTTLLFAVLLAAAAFGTSVIHPFLALLGLVGGLGWLSTAWTDLFLWKRETVVDVRSANQPRKARAAGA